MEREMWKSNAIPKMTQTTLTLKGKTETELHNWLAYIDSVTLIDRDFSSQINIDCRSQHQPPEFCCTKQC